MNKSERLIKNPVVSSIKLKTLKKLTKQKLDEGFYDTLLRLLNSEEDVPSSTDEPVQEKWWKEAVFYQKEECLGGGVIEDVFKEGISLQHRIAGRVNNGN